MQSQATRDTTPEVALRRAVHKLGLRYRVHRRPVPCLRRTADLVFSRWRVAVFVDGCFWHGCPVHGHVPSVNTWYWPAKIERNRSRDDDTNQRLASAGWSVVRVWEHEDPTMAAAAIARVLKTRKQEQA
ncbi:MAG: very short patch repair endonuclease [Actinobacteria bacterium]|nr:very short patch repair endonuclease [Actinomycetota bacterium]